MDKLVLGHITLVSSSGRRTHLLALTRRCLVSKCGNRQVWWSVENHVSQPTVVQSAVRATIMVQQNTMASTST